MNQTELNQNYDCIVIGAGITGLIAARDLSKKMVKVLLVEATDRLGGRIYDDAETFQHQPSPQQPPLHPEAQEKNEEEAKKKPTRRESYCFSLGGHKFYPSNNEYLMNEFKRYQLSIQEIKYQKTFIQIKDYHLISLYELFQRLQKNLSYQMIVKEFNDLSILIDPLHAPFDYDSTGDYYNSFEYSQKLQNHSSSYLNSLAASSSSPNTANSFSASIPIQQKYYEIYGKNILQSDLYHQYDVRLVDYLKNHKALKNEDDKEKEKEKEKEEHIPNNVFTKEQQQQKNNNAKSKESEKEEEEEENNNKNLIMEFFLLSATLLFEMDSSEISLLMFLNMINLFHFKFENILSFLFHSYHTIHHEDGMNGLLEHIFQDFIDSGGHYLLNTPLISIYQNIHYYQASLNNFYGGGNNNPGYNLQNTPYYPQTRPTTTAAAGGGSDLPLPTIAPADLQPVRVKTAYPITNTFLQLPADITNIICKLANGELYQCKQIILTVPINCLPSIQFFPNLSIIFQRAIERCYPSNSTNLLQLYAVCSNYARDGQVLPPSVTNKSNVTNRMNRILAFPSAEAVRFKHDVYQSLIHHRKIWYYKDEEETPTNQDAKDDITLISLHGIRRSIVERKQESFELMHPDIEKFSKRAIMFHDFIADPFIRTNWFHLRNGTRNLYLRMCVEATAPWRYSKQNQISSEEAENANSERNNKAKNDMKAVGIGSARGTIPVLENDDMSLYITNADLSPRWTGWIEGGVYMGKKAAEILYPRLVRQPITTNFAKKNVLR